MSENTCHICYEGISEGKGVTCENGHSCCQKHHLERVRAIYQEGRSAFEGLKGVENANGQDCFLCRCYLPDALFSMSYFKCLVVIIAIEIPKMRGQKLNGPLIDQIKRMEELSPIKSTKY